MFIYEMLEYKIFKYLSIFILVLSPEKAVSEHEGKWKQPSVMISVLVRNKEHSLSYFLSALQEITYPKNRLSVLFQTDNNIDKSLVILEKWKELQKSKYHSINIIARENNNQIGNIIEWNDIRYKNIISLREFALTKARDMWADYLLSLDADVFFTDKNVLNSLISKQMTVVAPMLQSDTLYSNFWCGMGDDFYYRRTEDYKPIFYRNNDKIGCHIVPMIHSAVLIDLRTINSNHLTYNPEKIVDYNGPLDDIIAFAISANKSGVNLFVCNDLKYGYITTPLSDDQTMYDDKQSVLNVKLKAISDGIPLNLNNELSEYVIYPPKQKFGFDEIYMINLKRREDRRKLRLMAFKELGVDVKIFEAFDGLKLTPEWLDKNKIKLLKEYEDPYFKRPMKMGEVGCFLSHYYIWLDMIKHNHHNILILEDDLTFVPYFNQKLLDLLQELKNVHWELMYLGRKILNVSGENFVTDHLVEPQYSYWTLGYALTLAGAKKLVNAKPLEKLIPVDEYLPIMYGKHPNQTISKYFPQDYVYALSAEPLLLNPTHYTGQPGYISDTEDSEIVLDHSHNEL